MKFRGYYREAPVLKYTPGVWHLQFQREDAGWIRWADRGLGHKHASSIESCAGSAKFRCRVYNTASCLLNVLPTVIPSVCLYVYLEDGPKETRYSVGELRDAVEDEVIL